MTRADDPIRAGTPVRTPAGVGEVTCVKTAGNPPQVLEAVVLLDDSGERETFGAAWVEPLPFLEQAMRERGRQ